MRKTISTPQLTFRTHRIRRVFSEVLADDNQLAIEVARPLFDAGIEMAALTERRNHQPGPSSIRTYHEMTLLLQGDFLLEIDGKTCPIQAGDIAILPAGLSWGWGVGRTGAWWIYFGVPDSPAWDPLKKNGAYVRPYESAARMFLLLRDTLDAMASRQPVAIARARDNSRALVNLLKHEMIRPNLDPSGGSLALLHLAEEIKHAPAKRWDRQAMAKALNLTVSQMTRFLRNELGVSPKEMVIRQRVMKATELLTNTPWKIESIAEDLGYSSLYSFTRLFTQHIGMPPGKYRARFTHLAKPPTKPGLHAAP